MSEIADLQKILEVKIRPYPGPNNQERPDQKGLSRVYLSREGLHDLKLESGQVCYIWKPTDNGIEIKKEAIAWLTIEKSLSKKVVQISKAFQEACDFKLGDDVVIQAAGALDMTETIILKDMTALENTAVVELRDDERPYWEWFVRENLSRAEVVFGGMTFKNLSLRGPKRTLRVESVNDRLSGIARYQDSCTVKIMSRNTEISVHTSSVFTSHRLEVTGIAGIDNALLELNEFLSNFDGEFIFKCAQRSCAVLLHGEHGTGKTFVIERIIASGWAKKVFYLEEDTKPSAICTIFKDAKLTQPSIIVIDSLESLVSDEGASSRTISRILGKQLDILSQEFAGRCLPKVLVLATALNTNNIPLELKKRGRLRTEILLPIPDVTARKAILKSLNPLLPPEDYHEILDRLGERTHAYTAEDLVKLFDTACDIAERAARRKQDSNPGGYFLSPHDFEHALLKVRPTAMHDITLQPPSVKWDEIGGQDSVKKALRRAVETHLLNPERMKRIGASVKKGLLLYGPPGCSKTLSAQAMATEIKFNFFAVKGAELLNMYVGESERAIRNVFARARAASPSIIFFDEIESIGSKRERSGRNTGVNVLTTLLNEMDGIESLKGVTVLAATNQPQALDLALLRPGRFDKLLYVAPPDFAGREEILNIRKQKMDLADDVDIRELARLTDGYTGAELVNICDTACDEVVEGCEKTGEELQVHMKDFLTAIKSVKRQITPEMIAGYERWAKSVK
ncbi:hypothetical protein K3495_g1921 [Podosphaera aphanis]|nr:hypothetical protein K3495_g1921 [Podosphaera aphanis]